MRIRMKGWKWACNVMLTLSLSIAAANSSAAGPETKAGLACDESLKSVFAADANTRIIVVKAFSRREPLVLNADAAKAAPSILGPPPPAGNDICLVKLVVGPGHPGPEGAPSTSKGIGIEIWLPTPANWNGRIHALGGGGWHGGAHTSPDLIGFPEAAEIAGTEGAVSSNTDTGHGVFDSPVPVAANGSFAMKADGTINHVLWKDFASRAIYEQAVKTKALATAYYGRSPKRAYWEGGSTGGRQGLKLAQEMPELYDGIIADYPAINWTRFITAELYPQIVFQRDLNGVPPTREQQDLVSNAAIAACDVVAGKHLGYVLDPATCTYDPTKDANVLCVADGGNNSTSSCVSRLQATAMNKAWYGMTADGSVADPADDNGWSAAGKPTLPSGAYRWFGLARGTSLYGAAYISWGLAGLTEPRGPFLIAADLVAIELQNPTLAEPSFVNATGNGRSLWKTLSYPQLSNAFDRGIALNDASFSSINTDNPDLSAFKKRGGKMLTWHGYADELIMPQGTINYYRRVVEQMGDLADVQSFYRLYMVPGLGHGTPNGTSNPAATPPNFAPNQFYKLLIEWVEKGKAPDRVVLQGGSGKAAQSMPICAYPKKATYKRGNPKTASSYTCS